MVHSIKSLPKKQAKAKQSVVAESAEGMAPDIAEPEIIQRPDGYYWSSFDGEQENGPYETFELAQAARDAVDEEAIAPGESLREAERDVGISDWIDAETGEPAEGQSPPHIHED